MVYYTKLDINCKACVRSPYPSKLWIAPPQVQRYFHENSANGESIGRIRARSIIQKLFYAGVSLFRDFADRKLE